jgi:hypothetical protein
LRRPVTVFYEDSAAPGPIAGFGPHRLVVQCVADDLRVNAWELRGRLLGIPRGGSAVIRADCRENPSRFVSDGRLAFAVYDGDRLAKLLGLRGDACKAEIKTVLLGECPWREHLRVVILDRNLESVLSAARACDASLADERTWELALRRKLLAERDAILHRAATEARRTLRDCVRKAMPSFDYLVTCLAACAG